MKWESKGVIFNVRGQYGWMNSHAQVPAVLSMPDRFRVYFSTRLTKTESRIARVDFSLDWQHVLDLSEQPVLELGRPGTFDEHGNMPSSVIEKDGKIYLYYSGWSRRTETPYANYTGLAVSDDNGFSFKKISEGPIIAQDTYDPFSATSPEVFIEDGEFHCFYCSGTGWIKHEGKYEHVYDIKYAKSSDGIHWNKQSGSIIPQLNPEEAITRPSVVKIGDKFYMWFCSRGTSDFRGGENSYKIGLATSHDLKNWQRHDTWVELDNGIDQQDMQAYPCVIKGNGMLTMLFNGSGFGQSGILLATTKLNGEASD